MKKLTLFILLISAASASFAQNGFLRGTVYDGTSGEGLLGATISQQGTTSGTTTDFNGNYSLSLAPGTYTIEYRFFSYQTKTVSEIVITADEVTALDVTLHEDTQELEEVVVTAEAIRDNEVALLSVQKKSGNTMDGISSMSFKKIGDGNLAGAIKRVTGVAIQEGKYVYVRGLGDRYTKTTLNGMSIPGLDPDRNDVQMDIFPTSILENVMVYKTFSPDLSGDFTGGTVNVETKSFPEEKQTSISFGLGYNPNANLRNDFVLAEGSGTDFLGFDSGSRNTPFLEITDIPDPSQNDPELETITRGFNDQLGAKERTSFLDTRFSINHGNQVQKGKYTIGYGAIFNYQNNWRYFDNAIYGQYRKDSDANETELFTERRRFGTNGENNVLWSALLNSAVKFDNHEFGLSLLRTQNGVSTVIERLTNDVEETGQTLYDDLIAYSQRSVTNTILSGKHNFEKFQIEWSNALTFARTYDPDYRATNIAEVNQGGGDEDVRYSISTGDGGGVRRFSQDLNEWNDNFTVDFTKPFGEKNKFKAGAALLYKSRNYDLVQYSMKNGRENNVPNDPNWLMQSDNIWTLENRQGTYISGGKNDQNGYDASSMVTAAYAMADMKLTPNLRAIYGARIEKADMFFTGVDIRWNRLDNEKTLDELDILPSVNLVYTLSESMNLRASYGKTLARPSFREKSNAQIPNPERGGFFNGNIDLEQTNIHNFDVRLESFFGANEMFSVSGYYKDFTGHIELVTFDVARTDVTPRNIGSSRVYGAEFEFRKNILMGLSAGTNISITKSEVDTKDVIVNHSGLTEYESRVNNARTGETVSTTRPMAGQSPFLINTYLNYASQDGLINASLAYNVQGESIYIVGVGSVPDRYAKPFHSLNFNIYRDFGLARNSRVTLGLRNLLNSNREFVYKNYGDEKIFTSVNPGVSVSVKYSYKF